jgi:hypothetical protein
MIKPAHALLKSCSPLLSHSSGRLLIAHVKPLRNSVSNPERDFV